MGCTPSLLQSPQGRILVVAPAAAISSISIAALGWSVMVRCGWTAWPFLLLTVMYSLAQLPAYFDKIVLRDSAPDLRAHFDKLYLAFVFLAMDKVLYAWSFFGYFLSSAHNIDEMKLAKYWPTKSVKMDRKFAKWFRWLGVTLVAGFLGALGAAFVPGFVEWLSRSCIDASLVGCLRTRRCTRGAKSAPRDRCRSPIGRVSRSGSPHIPHRAFPSPGTRPFQTG